MKTQKKQTELEEKAQSINLLRMLGINFDPVANASGLVNLINQSEEMPFKREMFDKQHQLDASRLGLEGRRVANEEQRSGQQIQQGERRLNQEDEQMSLRTDLANKQSMLQLLGMGIDNYTGQGFNPMVNPAAMQDVAGQLGFADLFKAPQSKKGRTLPGVDPRKLEASKQQWAPQQGF